MAIFQIGLGEVCQCPFSKTVGCSTDVYKRQTQFLLTKNSYLSPIKNCSVTYCLSQFTKGLPVSSADD